MAENKACIKKRRLGDLAIQLNVVDEQGLFITVYNRHRSRQQYFYITLLLQNEKGRLQNGTRKKYHSFPCRPHLPPDSFLHSTPRSLQPCEEDSDDKWNLNAYIKALPTESDIEKYVSRLEDSYKREMETLKSGFEYLDHRVVETEEAQDIIMDNTTKIIPQHCRGFGE